jgi:hypothetical protein
MAPVPEERGRPRTVIKDSSFGRSPIADGSNINQTVIGEQHIHEAAATSSTNVVVLPSPASGVFSQARYDEWRKLDEELRASIRAMGYAFVPIHAYKEGDLRCDPDAAIQRGYDALQSRLLVADALKRNGIFEKWDALVLYVHSAHEPRERGQRGAPTEVGFNLRAKEFLEELGRIARKDLGAATPQHVGFASPALSGVTAEDSAVARRAGIVQHHDADDSGIPESKPTTTNRVRPNIAIVGARKLFVHQGLDAVVFYPSPQHIREAEAVVADVTNDAQVGTANVGGNVKAIVIYPEHGLRVAGSWLEIGSDTVEFNVDDSHSLILGLVIDGGFSVPGTKRVRDEMSTSIFTDPHPVEFERAAVTVRLTDANSGQLYCERRFEVGQNPLRVAYADQ